MKNMMSFSPHTALVAVMAAALLLPSCTHEQDDYFDQTATHRLQSKLDHTWQLLREAPYGWAMDYYPDRDLDYGGYAYAVRFDSLRAEVFTELSPGQSVTSFYSLQGDDGAVLTFDTYNTLMHFFATPSSSEYEAKDGDFEFVIDSVASDYISMHGKRNLNTVTLHPLSEPPAQYLQTVIALGEDFASSCQGTIGGQQVSATIDLNRRRLLYTDAEGRAQEHFFVFTDQGLRFYHPLYVGQQRIDQLTLSQQQQTLTSTDGQLVSLSPLPHDSLFVPYSQYEGQYYFSYFDGRLNPSVRLVANRFKGGFDMVGLSSKYNIFLSYDKNAGCLHLNPQMLGVYENPADGLRYAVYLMAWNSTAGNLTWTTEAGMKTVWNGSHEAPVYQFVTNDYVRFQTDSYYVSYPYVGDDGLTKLARLPSDWGVAGQVQVQKPVALIRRVE